MDPGRAQTTRAINTIRMIRLMTRKLTNVTSNDYNVQGEMTLELDSYADTCVLGCDALIISNYDRPVEVEGDNRALGTKRYDTMSSALAYDHPQTGEVLLLVLHQAIHIPHLDHHLLCLMQCCVNDMTVGETPKFMVANPTDKTHALTIPDDDNPTLAVHLPLALRGVTSLLNVQKPTLAEWNSDDISRYHLTSETQMWDPTTILYEEQEAAMVDHYGYIVHASNAPARGRLVINELNSLMTDTADITDGDNFHVVLQSWVQVSSIGTSEMGHFKTKQTKPIDHQTLASRWMISPEKALQMINVIV
jgi:hypothetical protein